MSAILSFTVVLTVFAMQNDYFVTITKSSEDPEDSRLELTLRNGSFQQAFTQDLLGECYNYQTSFNRSAGLATQC